MPHRTQTQSQTRVFLNCWGAGNTEHLRQGKLLLAVTVEISMSRPMSLRVLDAHRIDVRVRDVRMRSCGSQGDPATRRFHQRCPHLAGAGLHVCCVPAAKERPSKQSWPASQRSCARPLLNQEQRWSGSRKHSPNTPATRPKPEFHTHSW